MICLDFHFKLIQLEGKVSSVQGNFLNCEDIMHKGCLDNTI